MRDSDLFVQTIESVYASGLESERLPQALEATSPLLGAAGACFEVIDKPTQQHQTFCVVGLPTIARDPSLAEFARHNPRMPFALRQSTGHVAWDHQILDEARMARDAFYAGFLPQFGLRYFLGAIVEQTPGHVRRCQHPAYTQTRSR